MINWVKSLVFRLLLFYMKYYVLAPIIICCDVILDSTQVIRTEGDLMNYDAFCLSVTLCIVFTPVLIFSIHHCSINCLSNGNRNWDKIPLFLTQTVSHQAFTLTHTRSCQTKGGFSSKFLVCKNVLFLWENEVFTFLKNVCECWSIFWLWLCSSHSDASFDCDYKGFIGPCALHSIVRVWKRSPTHTRLVSHIVVVCRLALTAAVIHYPQDHDHNHML